MEAAQVSSRVESFLSTLFDPSDRIEVRFLPSRRRGWFPSYFALVQELPRILQANASGENIYFGANLRNAEKGDAGAVSLARCLFADFDGVTDSKEVVRRIEEAGLPEATALVLSGHGCHAWWRLSEAQADLKAWSAMQLRIAEALGSDSIVHDPPRIMRLPETMNTKRSPWVRAELVYASEDSGWAKWSEFDEALPGLSDADARKLEPQAAPIYSGTLPPADRPPLAFATLEFLAVGAKDGERNARLFRAACDMAGAGWPRGEAEQRLGEAAQRCGLDQEEVAQTIESAWSKPRNPAKPPEIETDGWVGFVPDQPAAVSEKNETLTSDRLPAELRPTSPPSAGIAEPAGLLRFGSDWIRPPVKPRPLIANTQVVWTVDQDGNQKKTLRFVSAERMAMDLFEATGPSGVGSGWPRSAGCLLFVPRHKPGDGSLPNQSSIQWLGRTPSAMLSWVHEVAEPYWTKADVRTTDGEPRSAPTKGEFADYLWSHPAKVHSSVEFLPHVPPVRSAWYCPCSLPDDGGAALKELVSKLNADTEEDRLLMLAMLLTPFWGGPCGTRPAFVITSAYGRGTGKTTTAELVNQVAGSAVRIGPKDDWDKSMGRILSEEAMTGRVVVMDNVKGRVSGQKIEELLTTPTIEGWKPYVGHATRPNRLTTIITANSPSLSNDLSERAVVVRIGKQQWESGQFIEWAAGFIEANRPALIGAMLQILAMDSPVPTRGDLDRWAAWQVGVLAKAHAAAKTLGIEVGSLASVCQAIKDRRVDVDDDAASAEEVADAIREGIRQAGADPDGASLFLTTTALTAMIHLANLGDGMSGRGVVTWIRGLAGMGALSRLEKFKDSRGRGWRWSGSTAGISLRIDYSGDPSRAQPNLFVKSSHVAASGDDLPI